MNGLYDEARIALHGIWQRRWLAVAVAWGVCLAGWLVVAMIPNTYESRARVSVQMQSLLPGKIGITASDQQRDVDRVRQTLTSSVSLEKVVRGTDLALTATSDRDVADRVAELQKAIKITAQPDNLFEISATASNGSMSDAGNAKLARAIVQKLIDIFVEGNMAGGRDETSQTLKFLDTQLADRQRQLQDAETRRADFEARYLGLLPGTGSVAQRLDTARTELGRVESDLVAAQSSLSALGGQIAGTQASMPGAGGSAGPARARLAALEGQLADARAKGWTDNHPDVVAIRNQMAAARGAAAREPAGTPGVGATQNPLYTSLRSMQAERQATVAALSARRAQLQSDLAQMTSKQAQEPEVAAEQARINRDYQVLKTQYDKLLADREDVKLRGQVQTETDAIKFSVIDPASAPRKPAAPNRPLLLTGVLLFGLLAGVGAAFAMGQLRTSFATAARLERLTGLPVAGSISEVVDASTAALRQKRLKLFGGALGGLTGAYAILMAIEFVQRGMIA